MRVVLAVVVVIGCALCGRAMAHSAERRYRLLLNTLDALRMLRVKIVETMEPLNEALLSSGSEIFAITARSLNQESSVSDAWLHACRTACARGGIADCLEQRDCDALNRLFEHLGGSGRSTQNTALLACIDELELLKEDAHTRASASGRLYTSIGILLGLALAVLLI